MRTRSNTPSLWCLPRRPDRSSTLILLLFSGYSSSQKHRCFHRAKSLHTRRGIRTVSFFRYKYSRQHPSLPVPFRESQIYVGIRDGQKYLSSRYCHSTICHSRRTHCVAPSRPIPLEPASRRYPRDRLHHQPAARLAGGFRESHNLCALCKADRR